MKEEIHETRLDNGLTILTDRMEGVRSVTLGFFFRVGSRNEPDELNGISHFIEHAVFKGTRRRSAIELANEQDRLGGNLDAFTSHEETGFAIKVIDDQVAAAFGLIAEMLAEPRFDEADLEAEQRVIIEEIKMMDDSPEEFLGEIFHQAYFPGHPLGLSIAGTPESVRSFNSARTVSYHREAFTPRNLVIAAAGSIEHDQLVTMAERVWNANGDKRPAAPTELREAPRPAAPILIENRPELEQAHVLLATPFVAAIDERRYAADLLANIVGGGTSSRLWQKIREERGLAYSVGASALLFSDCGIFSVSAATSPAQVGEVVDIAVDEMRWVVRNGVTDGELRLVKDQTRASIILGLEDSAGRAATLAHSEMVHGRQIPLEETLAKLEAVTASELQAIASEFFKTESIAFAALGDLGGLKMTRERLAVV